MSALVIDTSSWISYFAGHSESETLIEESLSEGQVYLPLLVVAELLSGRMSRKDRARLEELLVALPTIGRDLAHWFRVGGLRAMMASKGLSVSTPDAHVAQCALDLDATLLTKDTIFAKIAAHRPLRIDRL